MLKKLHLRVPSLSDFRYYCAKYQLFILLSANLWYEQLVQLFFMLNSSVRKTLFYSSALTLPPYQREPLLPPKRASFLQKREKWLFLLGKVCYVAIPHYLCIRKRSGGCHSQIRFHRVPSPWLRSDSASGGEGKRETGTGHRTPNH